MSPTTLAFLLLAAAAGMGGVGDEIDSEMKTVIGPRNPDLNDGATALLQGRIEEGIRLTHRALAKAHGSRERQAANSNLCAGYVMAGKFETAINYCDAAIAENDRNWRALGNRALAQTELGEYTAARADLDQAESIAPKSKKLRLVRNWLLDQTEPVSPSITIDDRRDAPEDEDIVTVEPDV